MNTAALRKVVAKNWLGAYVTIAGVCGAVGGSTMYFDCAYVDTRYESAMKRAVACSAAGVAGATAGFIGGVILAPVAVPMYAWFKWKAPNKTLCEPDELFP